MDKKKTTRKKPAKRSAGEFTAKPLDLYGLKDQPLNIDIIGFTTPTICGLINKLASKGSRYLEIGVYRGVTLASAAYDNDVECIGVDNYSWPERKQERNEADARNRIAVYGDRVKLIKGDFERVIPTLKGKFDCVFYDAAHDYKSQKKALDLIKPLLSVKAYLIVDDTNGDEVRKATAEFCKEQGFKVVFEKQPAKRADSKWWGGIQILKKA
jgi:predicted O-methyltransferase YrrM